MRLRIHIDDETGKRLAALPRVLRSKAASILLASAADGIDLAALLEARRELVRLDALITAALRISNGKMTDLDAVRQAAAIIHSLTRK